ncbi:hypothetical protein C8J57DRAFT_1715666 [Mycena rebaudengoi]|nr:hypothetical protein C8J57DRAFT_1715666 [Mycena rebaudengoi]
MPTSRQGTPNLDRDYSTQLKDLLQCTPNKSGHELGELRAQIAAGIDDYARAYTHCKRRIVDLEDNPDEPRRRARRGRNHHTDGVEIESPLMAKEFEERARRYGCRFVVLCGLWFTLGGGDIETFFTTEPDEDNDYDPKLRFAATDNDTEHELRQAQLREVVDVLLQDLVSFLKSPWVTKASSDGMRSQRALPRPYSPCLSSLTVRMRTRSMATCN